MNTSEINLIDALVESVSIVRALDGMPPVTREDIARVERMRLPDTDQIDEGDYEARYGFLPPWQ